jgi:hypothetical protein
VMLKIMLNQQVAGLRAVRKQERIDGVDGARWRPKASFFHHQSIAPILSYY